MRLHARGYGSSGARPQGVLVEYGSFFAAVAAQSDPRGAAATRAALAHADPGALAQRVLWNLPPPRLGAYQSNDFGEVKVRRPASARPAS